MIGGMFRGMFQSMFRKGAAPVLYISSKPSFLERTTCVSMSISVSISVCLYLKTDACMYGPRFLL